MTSEGQWVPSRKITKVRLPFSIYNRYEMIRRNRVLVVVLSEGLTRRKIKDWGGSDVI